MCHVVTTEPLFPVPGPSPVPVAERAFFVDQFTRATIVVSLADPTPETAAAVRQTALALAGGGGRLVLVVGSEALAPSAGPGELVRALPSSPVVLEWSGGGADLDWMGRLWLAITDRSEVIVEVPAGTESTVGADLAGDLKALKLVVTDPGGGWGSPARSFVDVHDPARGFAEALADRQDGAVVAAVRAAIASGVTSVNLCRPEQVYEELFTFDGVGSLFTSGDYLHLEPLRVDDLPAVEDLVERGTRDGFLRPRTRQQVARLAVTGMGARVQSSGHLAGLVSLDATTCAEDRAGEVACLYTVSRFSGAGAGGLLIEGLMDQARAAGLLAVFAVTVSDTAAAFFARRGFDEVGQDQIPDAKWVGYDDRRRQQARAFWRTTEA